MGNLLKTAVPTAEFSVGKKKRVSITRPLQAILVQVLKRVFILDLLHDDNIRSGR